MSNASEIRLGGKLEKQKNLERKTIKEWIKYIQEKILKIKKSEKKRLANINLVSEKILNTDFKPKMEITMFFKYECWMADCPQHLIIDEN